MIFMGLIYNIALLMTMAMIQQVMTGNALLMRVRRYPGLNSIIWGLVYGGLGLVAMMTPVIFTPGIIFDGRSIILAVAGLFGGPVTAVVAAGMCGAYRLWLGGAGAAMGVSVIIEAAALGVTWRYLSRRHPRLMNGLPLLGFGLAVHLVMIGLMILLPKEVRWDVVARISLPVLVLYPIATMFICRLFLEQEERDKRKESSWKQSGGNSAGRGQPADAELTMRALKKNNLANSVKWVKDGAEALDYLFVQGQYSGNTSIMPPRWCCWIWAAQG